MDERFIELTAHEIRAQPHIANAQLPALPHKIAPFMKWVLLDAPLPKEWSSFTSARVAQLWKSAPPPPEVVRLATDTLQVEYGDEYALRCRGALMLMLFGHMDEAEAGVREAMAQHGDWAFAHHVLGLLHGARGEYADARTELANALECEPYDGARTRIQVALTMVEEKIH